MWDMVGHSRSWYIIRYGTVRLGYTQQSDVGHCRTQEDIIYNKAQWVGENVHVASSLLTRRQQRSNNGHEQRCESPLANQMHGQRTHPSTRSQVQKHSRRAGRRLIAANPNTMMLLLPLPPVCFLVLTGSYSAISKEPGLNEW